MLNSQGLADPNDSARHYGGGTVDGKADATVGTGYVGGTGANAPVPTDGYGMAGQNTNLDLSPTTVYTVDGDNWAQAQESCLLFIFFCSPAQVSWQHMAYPGLDASDFTFKDQVGNVDYYNADDSSINMLGALWTAAMTYASDPVDVAGPA